MVEQVAANWKEKAGYSCGDGSPEINFFTGKLHQQLMGEQNEEAGEIGEREHLEDERESRNGQELCSGKTSYAENRGDVCEEEDNFESYSRMVEDGPEQGEDMEACVGGSTIEKNHYEEWSGQEDGLLHGQDGGLLHAEEMESCLDRSFTEKEKCDGFESGVQGVVTGSLDDIHKKCIRNNNRYNNSNKYINRCSYNINNNRLN